MQDTTKRRALGRGLSALISAQPVPVITKPQPVTSTATSTTTMTQPMVAAAASTQSYPAVEPTAVIELKKSGNQTEVEFIKTNCLQASAVQPRQDFDPQELNELSQSIRSMGILQPILVRPLASNGSTERRFEIIAGERRWRAAQLAELEQVPVIIKSFSDEEASEVAIIENIQRSDLNPLEEAQAYQTLADRFNLNHHQIADKVGKDRSTISNLLRVLALPSDIQDHVRNGKLSLGHAKALLSVKEPAAQKNLATKVLAEEMTVRELESIVARNVLLKKPSKKRQGKLTPMSDFPDANDRLRQRLGTRTLIQTKSDGSGKITVDFFSSSDLDRLIDLICE